MGIFGFIRSFLSIIIIVALLGGLYLTNPGIDEFMEWTVEEIKEERSSVEGLLADIVAKPLLKNLIKERDYYFFSIYKIEVPESDDDPLVLGIAGNFIKLNDIIPEDMNAEEFIDKISPERD